MEGTIHLLDRRLDLWLFRDVENSRHIREMIMAGSVNPEMSFIDASVVIDTWVVQLAAYKALVAQQKGKLQTMSLHTELVFNLSGSKHITESLKRFGLSDNSKHLVVARFDATPEDLEAAEQLVKGTRVDLGQLSTFRDLALIHKFYKISPAEQKVSCSVDSVVCRLAARDC